MYAGVRSLLFNCLYQDARNEAELGQPALETSRASRGQQQEGTLPFINYAMYEALSDDSAIRNVAAEGQSCLHETLECSVRSSAE